MKKILMLKVKRGVDQEKTKPLPPNPHEEDGKWYWYDEAGDRSGPYDNEEEASKKMSEYAAYLNSLLEKEFGSL